MHKLCFVWTDPGERNLLDLSVIGLLSFEMT